MYNVDVGSVSRSDIHEANLLRFIRDEWLPLPQSIIPPERPYVLWDTLDCEPYSALTDYEGKLLDRLTSSTRSTLREWGRFEDLDRVGVWLSGGVDSSTLLYLTCKILGPDRVRAYSVDFGDQNEVERAKLVADWCDVRLRVKAMTVADSIRLTEEAVLNARSPVCTTHVLFASRLCSHDGSENVLSALGLDELQGGYPAHVNAGEAAFRNVEAELLWKCQSAYAWAQRVQSRRYVEVKFPFLRRELIAWCRGLPRTHKCLGRETKVRLRAELHAGTSMPERIVEAGRTVGTKGGFCPDLARWFDGGLEAWCEQNLPPHGLSPQTRIRLANMTKDHLWRKWRAATINTLLRLLDAGRFDYPNA